MSTKSQLLALLNENTGKYISGQKAADMLGISRAAVNKAATSLRKEGYPIFSRTGLGYSLRGKIDILSESSIGAGVKVPCRLHVYDTVDSTNDIAKKLEPSGGMNVVIADAQTKGRGRLGRSFSSPSGTGLYMSFAIKPDFDLNESLYVTMAAAIAVCRAIETVSGKKPKIKWVNDLFLGNKKICGILTEGQTNFESGKIDKLIIGIGINCFPGSFPEEVAEIAGSVADEQFAFSRSALASEVINELSAILENFTDGRFLTEYRRRCFILGKNIRIHCSGSDAGIRARAIDIDRDGGLVVEYMEGPQMREIKTLTSGEVSVRPE